MSNKKENSLHNELTDILNRFQSLSNYGETKLGALIAFNTAVIMGLTSLLKDLSDIWFYASLIIILLLLISLFFALSGLFAKKNNKHSSSTNNSEKNYYYFGYVANLNETTFLDELKKDYKLDSTNSFKEKNLSNQIVVLARIANRKFTYFNLAINFTIAGILTPVGWLIFHIYNNPNSK